MGLPSPILTAEPAPLTPDEIQSLEDCLNRLRAVCRACQEIRLPLLIDAEYFSVQVGAVCRPSAPVQKPFNWSTKISSFILPSWRGRLYLSQ